MPVVVLIRYRTQEGKEYEAARELAALIGTVTATEPACLGITMLRADGDASQILLHESWVDKESYQGPHMQTPHIRAFIERAPDFFTGPPEISFWHEL